MKTRVLLLLAFLLAAAVSDCCQATIKGKWRGDLDLGMAKLPIVFSFKTDAEGKTVATMDSPQQNAKDIPLEVICCSEDSVNLECRMIGASYSGRKYGAKIEGVFIQRGYSMPLTLTPEQDLYARRPQTPKPPFPYIEKDTVFSSSDGTRLAGTLTLPPEGSAEEDITVAVMVTGSGPQNRDEEILEHRPFAVIADYLARNGIATFRYDDRGVALSKGDYQSATIDTFVEDLKSAMHFVRTFSQFKNVGIIGHSEGGTLAVMAAAKENPDFIVSLAGAAVPLKDVLMAQNERSLDISGIAGRQKEDALKLLDTVFSEIKRQCLAGKQESFDVDLICQRNSLDVPEAVLESVRRNMLSRNGYFDSLVSLDPTEYLKKVNCPVLAINGMRDTQVEASQNLKALRDNVKTIETKSMEGLNHLMQHAVTGEMSEYGEIKETIAPEVLEMITDFIKRN